MPFLYLNFAGAKSAPSRYEAGVFGIERPLVSSDQFCLREGGGTCNSTTKRYRTSGSAWSASGAVASAPLIALGDRLGLYKEMTEQGWMTSEQLAERAGLAEHYVREWPAASGFVSYDVATARYQLENEMAMCFADETSPTFIPGFCDCAEAIVSQLA
jgi:hypothetical protein